MKKVYLIIFSVFTAAAYAQVVPNGDFETWSGGEPSSWVTANIISNGSAIQSTNAHGGVSAIKLETKALAFNPLPGIIPDTVPGLAILSANQNISQRTGIPYTAQPATFTFYYIYSPVGNDTGFAFVNLTKWNNATQTAEPVGQGGLLLNATASYTMGTSPITYMNQNVPDTLTIILASSRGVTFGGSTAMPGSILYADDVSLTGGTVGISDPFSTSAVSVFPNPASDRIFIATPRAASAAVKVRVYDVTGKTIAEQVSSQRYCELNTSDLTSGIYFYQLIDLTNNTFAGNGKFTIEK